MTYKSYIWYGNQLQLIEVDEEATAVVYESLTPEDSRKCYSVLSKNILSTVFIRVCIVGMRFKLGEPLIVQFKRFQPIFWVMFRNLFL